MAHTRTDADALRALMARQTDELAAEALRTEGQIPAERLEALGRLARLVVMRDAAVTALRRRWAVPFVALGTLACASVLLFARVSSTEVEMELNVSEFSFVLPTVQVISDAMSVSVLGVSGLRVIELPSADGRPGWRRPAADIFLAADRVGRRTGTVSISPITLPMGTRVSLRQLEGHHGYRLVLRSATPELVVSVNGPIRIIVPSAVNELREFSFPRGIGLEPDSNQVSLDFLPTEAAEVSWAFRSPLPVESLSLYRVDQFEGAEQTLVRRVSTIQSGTLYFESIDGRARQLRAGEGLHFAWSGGEIREWRIRNDGVVVRFHGSVRGMSSGSGEIKRSLMPTLIEWLRARHGLSLLWGTTAYVVGLFVTILGWWRRPT